MPIIITAKEAFLKFGHFGHENSNKVLSVPTSFGLEFGKISLIVTKGEENRESLITF